jgi:50S ribosomal protein L16 3-hydroxylase
MPKRTIARHSSLLGMPLRRFMREYWQQKPLLVRGALPDLRDPLTPEELAGLACEDGVESRIVRERGGARPWEVTWGPHQEAFFASLPERGWTLLVQELNRHVPEAALLLERFAFVPNVRVDDVMVSFAAPGGSVGAHLDSYDVFLVQGMGQRRWRYATKRAASARFVDGLELRILERFRPDVDAVLEPGDMLYLPPGFAHHGIAESPCLTYSIGFRSPGYGEMWKAFGAHLATRAARASALLTDPPLAPAVHAGAVPPALLARVRDVIRAMDTSSDAIDRWFASFATQLSPGHEITPPSRRPSETTIMARLARGDTVARSEEGRWAYLPRPRGALLLYVGGVEMAVGAREAELARTLCDARRFEGKELAPHLRRPATRALIVRLFAMGALRFGARVSAR